MEYLRHHLVSWLIWIPVLAAIAVLISPRRAARWTTLGITLLNLAATILLILITDRHDTAARMEIGRVGYHLGVDGISLPIAALTTLVCFAANLASWNVAARTRRYFALLLLTEATTLGLLFSLNLRLFLVLYVASMLPLWALTAVWKGVGGKARVVTPLLAILIGSLALWAVVRGFNLDATLLLLLAFFIRAGAFPLHGWLIEARGRAAGPVAMLLTTLPPATGLYGLLRVALPLYPNGWQHAAPVIAIVGVVGFLYGAGCATAQRDLRRFLAYIGVAQTGLAIFAIAMMIPACVNGAILLIVAGGICSVAMFFLAGVLAERAGHCEISRLGGLIATMPVASGFALAVFLGAMALPGFATFIAAIVILPAALAVSLKLTLAACLGTVITAAAVFGTFLKIFYGPPREEFQNLRDLNPREIAVLIPLLAAVILPGLLPWTAFLCYTNPAVVGLLQSWQ